MSEFIPSDEYVRDAYAEGQTDWAMGDNQERHEARFDRWLAEHDERVRREAAAEQREKDAQIAFAEIRIENTWADGTPMTAREAWAAGFSAQRILTAIREQGIES